MERIILRVNEYIGEEVKNDIHRILDTNGYKVAIGITNEDINKIFMFISNSDCKKKIIKALRRRSIIFRLDSYNVDNEIEKCGGNVK